MPTAPQPKRVSRRLWWLLGGVAAGMIVCVALGALALGWAGDLVAQNPLLSGAQENLTTAQIESIARIKLPASAAGVHALAGGFQDRYIFVRFDIDRADLPALAADKHWPALDSSGVAEPPFQPGLEPDRAWWAPRRAKRFASGSSFVDGIAQAVLIDMTDANRYIVYVQTFET